MNHSKQGVRHSPRTCALNFERSNRMHTGKIKKLIRDRGFGFIRETDGREIFFHRSNLVDAEFDSLNEEQDVEFEVENTPKGLSAVNVRLV
jgi:CspA family cold shock protein